MINRYVMIMKECLLIKRRNIIRTIWLLTIFICQKTFLIFLDKVLIFILYFLIFTHEYSIILDIYVLAKGILILIILLLKLLEKGLTRFGISTVNILIPKILLRIVQYLRIIFNFLMKDLLFFVIYNKFIYICSLYVFLPVGIIFIMKYLFYLIVFSRQNIFISIILEF